MENASTITPCDQCCECTACIAKVKDLAKRHELLLSITVKYYSALTPNDIPDDKEAKEQLMKQSMKQVQEATRELKASGFVKELPRRGEPP